ncbi:ATP-dependent helicase [Anaerosphaera multitolerans]|uniref:DNA 3'-5' helicase n=1 Tax=Anaerosphaera multitolerans TaxID=2487351 RepID=A0A437S8F0_9FIRM|nr:ATP-dependent helicase [Anaerosphaera multitolerans]RVU55376.1 ATP-dependent helicase [Anaerosphaera multitolerans]
MNLTEEQKHTIGHIDGPALVLAVPGSGKTTVLMYRTVNLIKHGVNPNKILTITFSKASALDMQKRFKTLFPQFNMPIKFSTIHAFCYRIILEYSRLRGKQYTLIEDTAKGKYDILKKIYFNIYYKNITEEKLEMIINQISYYKNLLINPREVKSDIPKFSEIYNLYEDFKISNGLIDFDDMILIALDILEKDEYIRKKYKTKYDYIQLDEGQDTSLAQFKIIQKLSHPKNNIFVVADDDQSIYGFRGSNPQYLLNLKSTYKNLKLYYLQNNFRSTKNIVNTSNLFINNNQFRFNKSVTTWNDYKEPVNVIIVENNDEEYKFIFETIKKDDSKDYAIVYRNNLCALGLVEYLERNNINFNIKDNNMKFFNHFVLKDILNILTFSEDTSNMELFSNFYYKIKGYISKKHINFLKTKESDNLLKTLLSYPGLPHYYKENIYNLLSLFKKLKSKSLVEKIDSILYDFEYDTYLQDSAKKFGFNYKSLKEYTHYLKYIAKDEVTLEGLIGRLKHLEFLMKAPFNSNSNLTLSTIHSIKGLEFNTVFVIDLVEGILPSNNSLEGDLNSLEEERRLFYVAMTRAKENLYLMYPKNHNGNSAEMSRFLIEVSKY